MTLTRVAISPQHPRLQQQPAQRRAKTLSLAPGAPFALSKRDKRIHPYKRQNLKHPVLLRHWVLQELRRAMEFLSVMLISVFDELRVYFPPDLSSG